MYLILLHFLRVASLLTSPELKEGSVDEMRWKLMSFFVEVIFALS